MVRDDLERLHQMMAVCFKHDGPYRLSSGQSSDYYYDGKLGTLDPALAWQAANVMLDVVLASGAAAVGGLEIGSIPIADAIGIAAHVRGRDLKTFVVRKAPKEHGIRSQVAEAYVADGPLLRKGRKVVIVDDVITTGASISRAITAVRDLGCEVTAVIALVERHEKRGKALRDLGIPILALFYTDPRGNLFIDENFVKVAELAVAEMAAPA